MVLLTANFNVPTKLCCLFLHYCAILVTLLMVKKVFSNYRNVNSSSRLCFAQTLFLEVALVFIISEYKGKKRTRYIRLLCLRADYINFSVTTIIFYAILTQTKVGFVSILKIPRYEDSFMFQNT